MTYSSWEENKVKEGNSSTGERTDVVIGMLRSASIVWKLPKVRRTFITVQKSSVWSYLRDKSEVVSNYSFKQNLEDGYISVQEIWWAKNKICEEVGWGWQAERINECEGLVEVYRFVYKVQARIKPVGIIRVYLCSGSIRTPDEKYASGNFITFTYKMYLGVNS